MTPFMYFIVFILINTIFSITLLSAAKKSGLPTMLAFNLRAKGLGLRAEWMIAIYAIEMMIAGALLGFQNAMIILFGMCLADTAIQVLLSNYFGIPYVIPKEEKE